MKLFVALALTAACLTAQAQRITWTPVTAGSQAPSGQYPQYGTSNESNSYKERRSYTHSGNNTFGSDGSTATTIGGSTFIRNSDGSTQTCTTVGSSTFCK